MGFPIQQQAVIVRRPAGMGLEVDSNLLSWGLAALGLAWLLMRPKAKRARAKATGTVARHLRKAAASLEAE